MRHGWRMRYWLPIEHWWPIKVATRAVLMLESSVLVKGNSNEHGIGNHGVWVVRESLLAGVGVFLTALILGLVTWFRYV